ncbi:YtxH domain-containing protein [Cytobacillus sp. Hm23]
MSANNLFKGMMAGAFVGGVIAMLNKETRKEVVTQGRKAMHTTGKFLKDPATLAVKIKDQIHTVRTTIEEIEEDVSFVTTKAHELKQSTPQMIEVVKDTKEKVFKDKEG